MFTLCMVLCVLIVYLPIFLCTCILFTYVDKSATTSIKDYIYIYNNNNNTTPSANYNWSFSLDTGIWTTSFQYSAIFQFGPTIFRYRVLSIISSADNLGRLFQTYFLEQNKCVYMIWPKCYTMEIVLFKITIQPTHQLLCIKCITKHIGNLWSIGNIILKSSLGYFFATKTFRFHQRFLYYAGLRWSNNAYPDKSWICWPVVHFRWLMNVILMNCFGDMNCHFKNIFEYILVFNQAHFHWEYRPCNSFEYLYIIRTMTDFI